MVSKKHRKELLDFCPYVIGFNFKGKYFVNPVTLGFKSYLSAINFAQKLRAIGAYDIEIIKDSL